MANCPECGKPLVKRTVKGKYQCENENCPVIYVRYPNVPALRVVVYESSAKRRKARA
jgi:ribosomal protein L37AE/L43A